MFVVFVVNNRFGVFSDSPSLGSWPYFPETMLQRNVRTRDSSLFFCDDLSDEWQPWKDSQGSKFYLNAKILSWALTHFFHGQLESSFCRKKSMCVTSVRLFHFFLFCEKHRNWRIYFSLLLLQLRVTTNFMFLQVL